MGERPARRRLPGFHRRRDPSGEIAGEIKKLCRDTPELISQLRAQGSAEAAAKLAWIVKEIGDSLWYLSEFASDLGVDLEEVARLNLRKLAERYGLDDPKIVPFPRKSADQAPAPKLGTAPVVVDGELLVIVLREFWTGEGNAGELEAVESAAV